MDGVSRRGRLPRAEVDGNKAGAVVAHDPPLGADPDPSACITRQRQDLVGRQPIEHGEALDVPLDPALMRS